jgi:hypothetical protein
MLNKVIRNTATNLIDEIKSLSGDKIITCVGETDNFTIDILANGQIGYQVNHHELLIEKLIQYMSEKGGLTVRQFSEDNYSKNIPYKNIYSALLSNDSYKWLSAEIVEKCHCTDVTTQKSIPPEEGVRYLNFPKYPYLKVIK